MSARFQYFSLVLALTMAAPSWAQMPDVPGVPPRFALVGEVDVDKGQVELLLTISKLVYETMTVEKAGDDGTTIQQTVTVPKSVAETMVRTTKLNEARIVTAGKERLDTAAALARLQKGDIVLLHHQGVKFDARYLNALNPNTLILLEKLPEFDATKQPVAAPAAPVRAVPRAVPPAPAAPAAPATPR